MRLTALGLVVAATLLSLACFPQNLSNEFEAVTFDSQGVPLAPREVLDALDADNTPLESLRLTTTQWDYAEHRLLGLTLKKSSVVEEFQRPNRWRSITSDVEYLSFRDGVWEPVPGESQGCDTQELMYIGNVQYERCGDEPWAILERPAYVVPDISVNDLLDKARELEELRRLERVWLDRRPRLVLEGNVPNKPDIVTMHERRVYIDIETHRILQIEETIQFGDGSEQWRPDNRVTIQYTNYNAVIIDEPVTD
ncbi:MAG: hypothetical protein OXC55_08735 [Chloroflexi bacterium]|nr:hypothetical protein [Chloroflexota bacterium]